MDTVLLEVDGTTAVLTLNRPKSLNAINMELVADLDAAMDELEKLPDLRCVIVTGSGEKAFAAGADIAFLETLDVEGARKMAEETHEVFTRLENFPCPVIAAVNGFALGGGLELALSCDIRIASDNAAVGLPETSLGIMPGWGGTQRLMRLIGYSRAAQLVFTGDRVKAPQALALGIVSEVVPQPELLGRAKEIAAVIGSRGPLGGVAGAKRAMKDGASAALDQGLVFETAEFSALFATKDGKGGLHAFNNKEKYEYKGE